MLRPVNLLFTDIFRTSIIHNNSFINSYLTFYQKQRHLYVKSTLLLWMMIKIPARNTVADIILLSTVDCPHPDRRPCPIVWTDSICQLVKSVVHVSAYL